MDVAFTLKHAIHTDILPTHMHNTHIHTCTYMQGGIPLSKMVTFPIMNLESSRRFEQHNLTFL